MSLLCSLASEGRSGSASSAFAVPSPWSSVMDLQKVQMRCIPRCAVNVCSEYIPPSTFRRWSHGFHSEDWISHEEQILKRMDGFGSHARAVLGANAETRLEEFKSYGQGWDDGSPFPPLLLLSLMFSQTNILNLDRLRRVYFLPEKETGS